MFDNLLASGFTVFAQAMVKFQPIWDRYKTLIALVLGVLFGWFVLGWLLFPVAWSDATPGHLHARYRSAYLAFTADEFYETRDMELLRERLGLDLAEVEGVQTGQVPWLADEDRLRQDMQTAIDRTDTFQLDRYLAPLMGIQQLIAQEPSLLFPGEVVTEDSVVTVTPLSRILRIVAIFAVVLLVLGALGVGWSLFASRGRRQPVSEHVAMPDDGRQPSRGTEVGTLEGETPVKSFNTPYVRGDDYFDPSFSIEIGPDFLGECGIGISETLGAGEPKKVTAFEAWLFDKGDIRTVTKVLASEYAFNDPDLREKLAPKGEVVMMQPGEEVILETSGLRVAARIRDLEYDQGASLPPNSFVKKVDFELQSWVKQSDGDEIPDIDAEEGYP